MWWRSVIFVGIFFGALTAIAVHLLWAVTAIICRIGHWHISYTPFGLAALGLLLTLWGLLAWGSLVGVWSVRQTKIDYESVSVPESFEGYRIVHISDLHADTYDRNASALENVIQSINDLAPDIIVFTGDMQTGSIHSVFRHAAALKKLQARDGIYSVLGNHDFFMYERPTLSEMLQGADELAAFESDTLGWTVLRNSHRIIQRGTESLAVAGVDNVNGGQGFHTIQMGDLSAATQGLDGVFTILLSHDPSHWAAEVLPRAAADITLSGHTHGAQIRLFGWSLANLMFKECDGRYDRNGRMLYVNAGLGCTVPFRIACPPEITLITLHSSTPSVSRK